MRYTYLIGALAIASLFVSCSKNEKATPRSAVRVETMVASPSEISTSRIFSGTVQESTGTTLSFSVPGTVQAIYVNQGDFVRKGQLIAKVDDSSLLNTYNIAKAGLDQARDTYNRMKMLHDSNSLSDMQWVEVQNTLASAQNAEAIAKRSLGDAALYAPFSGYVSEKYGDAGMNVAPAIPVVKIVDIEQVKVNIAIPENEISRVQVGQDATITIGSLGDATFTGKVSERGVMANPLSRTYDAKIAIDNKDHTLLPGMICDVRLMSEEPMAVIVLPPSAVLLDANNQNFVWVAYEGKAVRRLVDVAGMTDDGIIISSGISAGDSIIVKGQQKVSANSAIEVINK